MQKIKKIPRRYEKMRSKRLLTLLLVFCMVVSTLAPAAGAVGIGADGYTAQAP